MSILFLPIILVVYIFSSINCSWKITPPSVEPTADTSVEATEKQVVVIVPSYNNKRWYRKNLDSIFLQHYPKHKVKVIYIDDASDDGTGQLVMHYCDEHQLHDCMTIICNEERIGALANLYKAIHSCEDDAIIVTVDGDDWLPHNRVLAYINTAYQDENVWLTWGQFQEHPSRQKGFAADFPAHVVQDGSYRAHGMPVTHLRTFYAWLFKLIHKKDLIYENNKFYPMTWDKAMMAPMIEMAAGRYRFIDDVLYIYNHANPINDCKVDGELQVALREDIYAKEPYSRLKHPIKRGIRIPLS